MTPEVVAYLERADASVGSAQHQLDAGMPEFATSRAYYAMFYAASAMLADRGLTMSRHSGVSGKFGELFAKTGELPVHLHRWLIEAFEARQVADYAVLSHVTPTDADLHVRRAREFVAAVRQYLSERDPHTAEPKGVGT